MRVIARGILWVYHENLTYFLYYVSITLEPLGGQITISTQVDSRFQALPWRYRNTQHDRMGHIGQKALSTLLNKTLGCEITAKAMPNCEIYIKAKATTKVSRQPTKRASKYLETIHSDIWGPMKPLTWSKGRQYISFIDDSTRWADVAILSSKNNAYNVFIDQLNQEENQSDSKLKYLYSNNAREYYYTIKDTLTKQGIIGTYATPYAHKQNSLAKIFNQTILSKVRSILIQSSLSHRYQGEALIAIVYIYNHTPHSALEGFITLYEARYNKKLDISTIKTQGYKAYKRIPLEGLNKLQPRAIMGILMGYGNNSVQDCKPYKPQNLLGIGRLYSRERLYTL